jgi:hypothetical protein
MDDRKRARDDDLPIIGDYSDAQDARLRAETHAAGTPSGRSATPPAPARNPPPGARSASDGSARAGGGDAWRLDPSDVARHARLKRQRERSGPLSRAMPYFAIALVLGGAFAVYLNFDTLRRVTIDVPELSALFRGSSSAGAGARPAGGPESAEVESSIVVGTAEPTVGAAQDRKRAAEPAVAPPSVEPREPVAPSARAAVGSPEAVGSAAAVGLPAADSEPAADSAPTAAEHAPAPVAAAEQRTAAPPAPERFGFAVPKVTVSESDASATVLIVREGGSRGVSTVTWWTSDGTAKAGSDYVDLGRVVVKFAAGEQNRAIHIPIVGDQTAEDTESFYVNLAAGDDPSAEPQDRVEVVIEDDD